MFLFIFVGVVLVAAMHIAYDSSIYVQRVLDRIWQDPLIKKRASIVRRVKELCVDADVPEETAVLMTAKEHNVMDSHVRSVLGFMSPSTMKTLNKGGMLPHVIKACKHIGWFGR